MANNGLIEVLGENHLVADLRTAASIPSRPCWLIDSDPDIGDIGAYGEADISGESPWCGRPSENFHVFVYEAEANEDRRILDLLVSERDLV